MILTRIYALERLEAESQEPEKWGPCLGRRARSSQTSLQDPGKAVCKRHNIKILVMALVSQKDLWFKQLLRCINIVQSNEASEYHPQIMRYIPDSTIEAKTGSKQCMRVCVCVYIYIYIHTQEERRREREREGESDREGVRE